MTPGAGGLRPARLRRYGVSAPGRALGRPLVVRSLRVAHCGLRPGAVRKEQSPVGFIPVGPVGPASPALPSRPVHDIVHHPNVRHLHHEYAPSRPGPRSRASQGARLATQDARKSPGLMTGAGRCVTRTVAEQVWIPTSGPRVHRLAVDCGFRRVNRDAVSTAPLADAWHVGVAGPVSGLRTHGLLPGRPGGPGTNEQRVDIVLVASRDGGDHRSASSSGGHAVELAIQRRGPVRIQVVPASSGLLQRVELPLHAFDVLLQ